MKYSRGLGNISDKAKAISAELFELNLKNKLKNGEYKIKQKEMGRNRKLEEKTPKTGRNWMILKETGRNRGKKQEETGRNRKKQEETRRIRKKQEETVRNSTQENMATI